MQFLCRRLFLQLMAPVRFETQWSPWAAWQNPSLLHSFETSAVIPAEILQLLHCHPSTSETLQKRATHLLGSELGLTAEEVAGTCSVGEEAEVSSLDVPSQESAVALRARVPRMMSEGSQSSRLSYMGTLRFTV